MTRAPSLLRRLPVVAVLAVTPACTPPRPSPPAPTPARVRDEPLRSGAECDSVVWRAVMTADSTKVVPPTPKHTMLMPLSVSEALRGRTIRIRFRVNEAGEPDLAGTVIRGRIEERYLPSFTATLREWQFTPAVLDGCAVPGSTEITLTFR